MYNTGFDCVGWSPRRWSDGFRLLTSQQPSFSRWSAARRQRCGCDAAAPTGRRSDPAPPPSRWRHHRCCLHTWAFTTNKPRMGSAHTMYICVDSIFIGSSLAQVESLTSQHELQKSHAPRMQYTWGCLVHTKSTAFLLVEAREKQISP